MQQRFSIVPAVYMLLQRDGQLLMLRRAHTGFRDGYYSLPAGHVDGNESLVRAACREAHEEVGITIAEEDVKLVHVMHQMAEEGDHERLDFFFEAKRWQGEPANCEPEKCDDVQWYPEDALPEMTAPVVLKALERIRTGVLYSDEGF